MRGGQKKERGYWVEEVMEVPQLRKEGEEGKTFRGWETSTARRRQRKEGVVKEEGQGCSV